MRDGKKQRKEALYICNHFLGGIVNSLWERFSSNKDAVVMTCLSNFFNPLTLQSDLSSDIEVVSDYLGSIGFQGYRDEVIKFCKYVINM